jgi:hypothetical protein
MKISERADKFVKKYVKDKPEPDNRPSQIKVAEIIGKHAQHLRDAKAQHRKNANG